MNIIIKDPGKDPKLKKVDNDLDAFRKIVSGHIEILAPFPERNLLLICNEEGKLRDMDPNIIIGTEIIVGTVAIVRRDGEEFASLTDEDIKVAKYHLKTGEVKLAILKSLSMEPVL